ncbi:MAG: DUF2325 domain-containing protein [Eubacteriales bacterium]|jgi:hypothetical protein
MSIVIVGGHDRMHCRYKEICGKYGCKGKVFIQFPANFKNQIGSPDMVVVFTGTVAHKMVGVASEQAQKKENRTKTEIFVRFSKSAA